MKIAILPAKTSVAAVGRPAVAAPSDLQDTFAATLGGKIAEEEAAVPIAEKQSTETGKKKVDTRDKRDEGLLAPSPDQVSTIPVIQPPLPPVMSAGTGSWTLEKNDSGLKLIPNEARPDQTNAPIGTATAANSQLAVKGLSMTRVDERDIEVGTKTQELLPEGLLNTGSAQAATAQAPTVDGKWSLNLPSPSISTAVTQSTAAVIPADSGHFTLPVEPPAALPAGIAKASPSNGTQGVPVSSRTGSGSIATIEDAGKGSSDTAASPDLLQLSAEGRTAEHPQTLQAPVQPPIDLAVISGTSTASATVAVQTANKPVTADTVQSVPFSAFSDTNSSISAGTAQPTAEVDGVSNGPSVPSRSVGTSRQIEGGRLRNGKSFTSGVQSPRDDSVSDGSDTPTNLKTTAVSSHITSGAGATDAPHVSLSSATINPGSSQLMVSSGDAPASNPQAAQLQADATPSTSSSLPQHAAMHQAEATSAMSNAQLIQSVHGSEMRLGIKSADFGDITINTSLNHQALSAQISMEHTALGHALAAHLPAIEEKLSNAYGMQAKVELRSNSQSSSTNDSEGSPKQGRHAEGYRSKDVSSPSAGVLQASTSSPYISSAATTSRLDIRI